MQYGLNGLITAMSNSEIDARKAAEDAANQTPDPYAHLVDRLTSYIENCWQAARDAKQPIEQVMLEDLRQREGVYDPSQLAAIHEQGGSEIFMHITNLKCRALESWLRDVLFPAGERPFYCGPTHVPELSTDIQQTIASTVLQEADEAMRSGLLVTPREVYELARARADQTRERLKEEAETRSDRMEDAIDDLLLEGQWYDAMEDMIGDLVGLPFGVVKGPVIRKQRKLKWREDAQGEWTPMAEDELTPIWYSPSPLDLYWAADSSGPQDGYLFERIRIRHKALHDMIGVPGYKEAAIRAALEEYEHGYRIDTIHEHQRAELENKRHWEMTPDAGLDLLEFHGQLRGEWLIEWGMEKARIPDPDAYYEVTAAKVGRHVVRCVLNEDPMNRRPYEIAHFDRIKGQFAGRSLSRSIRDIQAVCNATARALINNMAIASGPLGEVEVDRLAEGEDATKLWPWRMIQTKSNRTGTPSPAVRWHNVDSNANQLMAVYQHFSQLADVYSGVQSFDHGVAARTGSAATASGLSMLMNASSRQIKRVVAAIDRITTGTVKRAHVHVMLHGTDPEVKGDVAIEARGANQLIIREQQQMRRAEFLAITNNPVDMGIIGMPGRAEILREAVKSLDIPVERVVPGREALMARIKAEAMAAIDQQEAIDSAQPGGGQSRGAPTNRQLAPPANQFDRVAA